MRPIDLKLWIYDSPKPGWTVSALTGWAQRTGLTAEGDPAEEMNPNFKPPADYPQREVEAMHGIARACPFYGRHLVSGASVGGHYSTVMVRQFGNQCALITSSHAPCAMEINGAEPRWGLCLRNPDNNGTGATG